MTFVSYAQNFEDVLLFRALREVEHGFYIDVGASHPVDDSVTHAFHQRGWRGINVEPAPGPFALLQAQRPDDVNLAMAVGAAAGACSFFSIDHGGGLSTVDPEIAASHAALGFSIDRLVVAMETLAAICDRHVSGPIHFLKIDVEGAERAVLEGADFSRYRPWIVLLEATFPNSQEQTHGGWADLLLTQGYSEVYFDGLNRFYLADEQAALRPRLTIPPNVFDDFVSRREFDKNAAIEAREVHIATLKAEIATAQAETVSRVAEERSIAAGERERTAAAVAEAAAMRRRASEAEQELERNRTEMLALRQERDAATARIAQLESAHAALLASTSWKATAPLRAAARLVRPTR